MAEFDASRNWSELSSFWNLEKEQDFLLHTVELLSDHSNLTREATDCRARWAGPLAFLNAYERSLKWRAKGFDGSEDVSPDEISRLTKLIGFLKEDAKLEFSR